jgi:hypothetical protein
MSEPVAINVIADYIKTNLNVTKLGMLINSLKGTLNPPDLRSMKANVIHNAIETFSDDKIKYVGRPGCDCIIPELGNLTLEVKYTSNSIFTKTGSLYPNISIKLFNSNGTKRDCLPKDYADTLLCVSNRGILVISTGTLTPYLSMKDDGILCTFPTNIGTVIADINEMDIPYTPPTPLVVLWNRETKKYIKSIPDTPQDSLTRFI